MCGLNFPSYDAYGLFRAVHSHTRPPYSHIVELKSHFYAHMGDGSQSLSTTSEQAQLLLDFLTLALLHDFFV